MTSEAPEALPIPTAATPARVGQGTAVEQSRAAAEVGAMVIVAQQVPRDMGECIRQMRESCRQKALAQRAFYRYKRGDGTVTGASVHLARELARCFGNLTYGITELRRDDEVGESEMLAWSWDAQANVRVANLFIVPHKRDKRGGAVALTDMRDIYENNANMGARRLREAIFAILPPWFTEEARDLCAKTLEDGGGKPLPSRITDAIKAFAALDIAKDQIEQKLGTPSAKWTALDIGLLDVIYWSIKRGEVSKDEEFPPRRVTVGEITGSPVAHAEVVTAEPATETGAGPSALFTASNGDRYENGGAD